jgi:hypothetical protein
VDSPDEIIKQLIKALDVSVNTFNDAMPAAQRRILDEVVLMTKDLDVKEGKIQVTAKNIRIVGKIRKELSNIILDKKYMNSVNDFVTSFDSVADLHNNYFNAVSSSFGMKDLYTAIKEESINATVVGLTKSGLEANVTNPLADILRQNITTGGRYTDFVKQLTTQLTTTSEGDGSLVRYAKTYTTDALHQYSANYHQAITDDLDFVWYAYDGGLQTTSREFCIEMIKAKNSCMRYFHKSQIPTLLEGLICSGTVELNPKTNLPKGFIKGTNASSFLTLRGGWGCKHLIKSVPSAMVPKELRQMFE